MSEVVPSVSALRSGGGIIEPNSWDTRVLKSAATQLPGKKQWRMNMETRQDRLWFEDTHSNWLAVSKALPNATFSAGAASKIEDAKNIGQGRKRLVERWSAYPTPKDVPAEVQDWEYFHGDPPMEHQNHCWFISRDEPAFAILFEQGCGKTKTAIDTAAWLYVTGKIDSVLVVAPNGVHTQWLREQILKWLSPKIARRTIKLHSGQLTNKTKRRQFYETLAWDKGLRIGAINVEAISLDAGVQVVDRWLAVSNCLLIIDEASRFKNMSANRTKNMVKLATFAKYRRNLTGTPQTTGIENLYSQYRILDPDVLGYTTQTAFNARYCTMGGFEGREVVGHKNLEELQEKIAPYSYRVLKKDCLDLPPKIYQTVQFNMTSEQKKHYDSLRKEMIAQIEDSAITALNGPSMQMKLQQVSSGFMMHRPEDDEEGRSIVVWREKNNPRTEAMVQILEDSGWPVSIIWCRFREDISQVQQTLNKLGKKSVSVVGGQTSVVRDQQLAAFMEGEVDILVGQMDAGGTGLNLQRASVMIYYSNSPSPEARWQSEDRAHRKGMTVPLTIYDLIARGSKDRRVLESSLKRSQLALETLSGLRDFLTTDDGEEDE